MITPEVAEKARIAYAARDLENKFKQVETRIDECLGRGNYIYIANDVLSKELVAYIRSKYASVGWCVIDSHTEFHEDRYDRLATKLIFSINK